jgi:hypothetical protein
VSDLIDEEVLDEFEDFFQSMIGENEELVHLRNMQDDDEEIEEVYVPSAAPKASSAPKAAAPKVVAPKAAAPKSCYHGKSCHSLNGGKPCPFIHECKDGAGCRFLKSNSCKYVH